MESTIHFLLLTFYLVFQAQDWINSYKITNWIIIYAKWYMYSCNLTNEKLFLLRFLTDLKHHAMLEKYVEFIRKSGLENCIWDILLNEL